MSLFSIFDLAGSGMHAQSVRLSTTASNLANAEAVSSSTGVPYRARHPVFSTLLNGGMDEHVAGVRVAGIVESTAPLRQVYRPGHPLADADGNVLFPNVDPVEEMADMISASRSYQTNVDIAEASKQMLLRTLSLGE